MFAKNCLQTLQLEILVDNLAKVMEVNAQDLLPLATQHGVACRIWPRSLEFIVRYCTGTVEFSFDPKLGTLL